MPFRHVVMFQWADGLADDHVDRVRAGLDALPAQIEQIRGFVHGPDAGVVEGNYDYVVVADFDSAADFLTYRSHPVHVALVDEHIVGKIAQRASVQYEI